VLGAQVHDVGKLGVAAEVLGADDALTATELDWIRMHSSLGHALLAGVAGLEAIRMLAPSLVVLDWEMPLLTGAELVRIVRSPGVFPVPDIPIIMLTGHGQRWRVIEAANLGVNEFLKKPVSGKALLDRIVAILTRPRPMVRLGEYYGPEPRRPVHERPERSEKVFIG